MKYHHLTSFYGSVERALAFHPDGSERYFSSVADAIQEAVKLKEEGPFTLVTRVELIPEPGGSQDDGPPPIYWEPTLRRAPDPELQAKIDARRQLQSDLNDALIAQGMKKGEAMALAHALPTDLETFDDAFRWASRRK